MRWRTVYTDSESLTGVAPECPYQDDPAKHTIPDDPTLANAEGVYDCCPHPHIECWGEASAVALAVFLTAMEAELCG